MDFSSDTRWMSAISDPGAFVMDGLQRAERAAAVQAARRLDAMIRLLCPEPANSGSDPSGGDRNRFLAA